jgi:predicted flavoprotein YhiN
VSVETSGAAPTPSGESSENAPEPGPLDGLEQVDLAVVGAGAAGLMAAIQAARASRHLRPRPRVVALDGARTLGAKILVAGGGRCNVTHHEVAASDFAGSSQAAIAKVLRAFPVEATVAFFAERGVTLVREETGKLFPHTHSAHTVLDALLGAAREAGVVLRHPWRVAAIRRLAVNTGADAAFPATPDHPGPSARPDALSRNLAGDLAGNLDGSLGRSLDDPTAAAGPAPAGAFTGFLLASATPGTAPLVARRVVLATGGRSLPKTGSDGAGYALARALGHQPTPHLLPALVPLLLPRDHPFTALSGVAVPVRLTVHDANGRALAGAAASGPLLFTHFGLSGPAVLDVSRHWLVARLGDPGARLVASFLPHESSESLDRGLRDLALRSGPGARTVGRFLGASLPDRLVETLCRLAAVDPATPGHQLPREARQRLTATLTAQVLPIVGDRGFVHAEVTAGGIPLAEVDTRTMASRRCPGLYLVGEILDVDGRIGGFNFQWAWASGTVAGRAAAAAFALELGRPPG